jgi:hypothetical protein
VTLQKHQRAPSAKTATCAKCQAPIRARNKSGLCRPCVDRKLGDALINEDAATKRWRLEYHAWQSMIRRCGAPSHKSYKQYGRRGITVCARWRASFWDFLADVGPKPHGMSLERVENNGNYEPGNVRWATPKEQARNRRNNRLLTFGSQTKPMSAWAEEYGIDRGTLRSRLAKGMSLESALNQQKFARPKGTGRNP